jgi:hypothetical protein
MAYGLQDILTSILTAVQDILGNIASAIADNASVIASIVVLGALTFGVVRYGTRIFRQIAGFVGGLM